MEKQKIGEKYGFSSDHAHTLWKERKNISFAHQVGFNYWKMCTVHLFLEMHLAVPLTEA